VYHASVPAKVYLETSVISYLTARPARDVPALLRATGLPMKALADMAHVAIATVHGMQFLLTWNCKHIANAVVLRMVAKICREHGFEPPVICTPEELMGV
jgi:hypothetical protein